MQPKRVSRGEVDFESAAPQKTRKVIGAHDFLRVVMETRLKLSLLIDKPVIVINFPLNKWELELDSSGDDRGSSVSQLIFRLIAAKNLLDCRLRRIQSIDTSRNLGWIYFQ